MCYLSCGLSFPFFKRKVGLELVIIFPYQNYKIQLVLFELLLATPK